MILPNLVADDLVYVASYFTGNGESGALFATSEDGFEWTPLAGAHVPPTVGGSKIVRDPCFFPGPDGEWHMVWTTDWNDRDLGVATLTSGDGWGEPRLVPRIAPVGARNAWAPEAIWDARRGRYVVVWSSTVPGAFPETDVAGDDNNHRFYMATSTDLRTFSPTTLMWDPGFNVIDATIVPRGAGYLMIAKDERKVPTVRKSLFAATAPAIEGPWTIVARDLGGRAWIEGPTVVDLGDRVRVYFDAYTADRWGAIESSDLRTWTDVSERVRMIPHARHGTVRRVPRAFLGRLAATCVAGGSG